MLAQSWSGLVDSVRTGKTAAQLRGERRRSLCRDRQCAGMTRRFNAAMVSLTRTSFQRSLRPTTSRPRRVVMDVGGGTGELIGGVLQRNPHLEGIAFDLARCEAERGRILTGSASPTAAGSSPAASSKWSQRQRRHHPDEEHHSQLEGRPLRGHSAQLPECAAGRRDAYRHRADHAGACHDGTRGPLLRHERPQHAAGTRRLRADGSRVSHAGRIAGFALPEGPAPVRSALSSSRRSPTEVISRDIDPKVEGRHRTDGACAGVPPWPSVGANHLTLTHLAPQTRSRHRATTLQGAGRAANGSGPPQRRRGRVSVASRLSDSASRPCISCQPVRAISPDHRHCAMSELGTRTSSLGAARPLPPSADIGPGGQSVGQAAQFCLGKCLANRVLDCFAVLKSDVLMVRSSATDADPHQPAFEAHGAVHDLPGG